MVSVIDINKQVTQFMGELRLIERKYICGEEISSSNVIELIDVLSTFHNVINVNTHLLQWREICSSVSNILTRWAYSNSKITHQELIQLLTRKRYLTEIFLAGNDHSQKTLLRSIDFHKNFKQCLTKILILISINNVTLDLFKLYKKTPKNEAFLLATAWLSERAQITKAAKVIHQKLVSDFSRYRSLSVTFDESLYINFCFTYMFVTYSTSNEKNQLKSILHHIQRKNLLHLEPKQNTSFKKVRSKRPIVVIIHEKFSDGHVMLRCYLPMLKHLEKDFEVIHMHNSQDNFEESNALCSIVIRCNTTPEMIRKINEISPDIIYYPSIGMSANVIGLSSLRLAPIQLQGFGHPAASHSPVIDGSIKLCYDFHSDGPEVCHEIDGFKNGIYMPFTLAPITEDITYSPLSVQTGTLNIAVNAKIMKLNPRFMNFLSEIDWGTDTKLHFFPAERGIPFISCMNLIHSKFPTAEVHKMENYENFMKNLARMDLAICPFPFGNTNGVLDCIHLGVPMFALKGNELCSQAEYRFLTKMGLPEFIFESEDNLKIGVQLFLNDQSYRKQATAKFQVCAQNMIHSNDMLEAAKYSGAQHSKWFRKMLGTLKSSNNF
jgi:predicted O-linked N-acetylglucosamine transferase (SPINDLY family)